MSAASGPGKAPHPESDRSSSSTHADCPCRRPTPAAPSPPSRSPRPGAESAREYRRRSAARGQHGSPAPARQAPGSSGVRGTRGGAVVVPFQGAPAPGGADDTLGRNHGASPRLESGALGDEARHEEQRAEAPVGKGKPGGSFHVWVPTGHRWCARSWEALHAGGGQRGTGSTASTLLPERLHPLRPEDARSWWGRAPRSVLTRSAVCASVTAAPADGRSGSGQKAT